MEKIIVNCAGCGSPIAQLDELKEMNFNVRCGNCRTDQTIICEKVFQIKVIPRPELSTVHPIVASKVKVVV